MGYAGGWAGVCLREGYGMSWKASGRFEKTWMRVAQRAGVDLGEEIEIWVGGVVDWDELTEDVG